MPGAFYYSWDEHQPMSPIMSENISHELANFLSKKLDG
jgi:hypothetical protein